MKKSFWLLVCTFFMLIMAEAQVPYFQHYYPLKKNEAVHTYTIFQDRTGFMWMGTDHGLFKFDGIRFQHFSKKDSLPDDHVTALAQDSLGQIWMGHANGKISILNADETIIPFAPEEGLGSASVSSILFDKKGNVWFATLHDGLYYYTQNRLYRLDESDGMPDLYIYDLAEDEHGRILAGTDGGLVLCMLNDSKVNIDVMDYDDGLPDNIIRKIFIDERNYAWLATEDAGLVVINLRDGEVTRPRDKKWTYGSVYDFVIKGNKVWIATNTGGLIIYNYVTDEMAIDVTRQEPGSHTVNSLLKDREGNIWLGTKSQLMRTHGDELQFIEKFEATHSADVRALAVDAGHTIWFSNSEGLYKRSIDENGHVVVEAPLKGTRFQNYTVISLYLDREGFLWAGLYGEGVIRMDTKTLAIKYIRSELRNGNVLNITGDENGVWLATLGGATHIDITTEPLKIKNYGRDDGLVSDFIYQVFIDSHKRVWFGTDGRGAVMMDDTGFHHFEQLRGSNVVFGFAEDTNGDVWANIQNDVLYKYDGKKFGAMETNLALRSDNVLALSSDAHGNLLLIHDQGIDIYDVLNNRIRYFGEEVGVKEKVPNLNAIARDKENTLYIGTNDGIIKFASAQIEGIKHPVPTLTELRYDDTQVTHVKDILLHHNQNYLTIVYLGLWYRNPAGVGYAYMLENYDQQWIQSQDREVTYSNLPPGSYVFKVKAFTNENMTDAQEASFAIVIQAPFWRTAAFYFLCIGFSILLGFGYIKYREKRLVKAKEMLEIKVIKRTLEIQAQAHEIKSQAEEIKSINENLEKIVKERTTELERKNIALEEYAFINAHKLRAPLASILGLINILKKSQLAEDDKEIVDRLNAASEKLENIVRDISIAIHKGDHDRTV